MAGRCVRVRWLPAIAAVFLAIAGLGAAGKVPTRVAYVSEQEGGISVIDLSTLTVVKRIQPENTAPRGLGLSFDGRYLFTANKDTADATVYDTRGLSLRPARRIPVGNNPEFVKINPSGTRIFTSFEPASTGGPPAAGSQTTEEQEPPSQIVEFRVGDWARRRTFTAGIETEGLEFSADGKQLIVANEGQNTLGIYDVATGKPLRTVNLADAGKLPRGVKRSPLGNGYAVTMEESGTLVLLDRAFHVVRTAPTGARPYGVAYDRSGTRILVAAAAARKLQVFTADSLQPVGEVSVGQRCWHFTFTPDDSKLLVACGRSNDVYVIDAKSYRVLKILDGFRMPWGIVTFPRSYGSLDLP